MNRRIVEEPEAYIDAGGFDDECQSLLRKVGTLRDDRLAGVITHSQHRQHMPVIEGGRDGKKGQGDVVVIRNDRKDNVGMEIDDIAQPLGETPPDIGRRIDRKLKKHRHHLLALTLRGFGVSEKARKLRGKRQPRPGAAVFDHFEENAGIKSTGGFVGQGRHPEEKASTLRRLPAKP